MELKDQNGRTEAQFLEEYAKKTYPKPSVTADIAVFSEQDGQYALLLIRRGGHPFLGYWALPGGFSNREEELSRTAARELEEETGLTDLPLCLAGVFSAPGRDPRGWVVSAAYCTVVRRDRLSVSAGDDAADARWFDLAMEKDAVLLRSGEETLRIPVSKRTIPSLCGGRQIVYQATGSASLAFDHADVILAAMCAAGILGSAAGG